jgi:hypothetical protein
MIESVEIPVVNPKKPLFYRVSKIVFTTTSLLFVITIIILDNILFPLTMFFIAFFSLVILNSPKQIEIIGSLSFYPNQLKFNHPSLGHTFLLKEIINIKLKHYGNEGDNHSVNPQSITKKLGDRNYLIFHSQDKKHSFELLLRKSDTDKLNEILNYWNKQKVQFKITNQWGLQKKKL